jgi:hypothetical protein
MRRARYRDLARVAATVSYRPDIIGRFRNRSEWRTMLIQLAMLEPVTLRMFYQKPSVGRGFTRPTISNAAAAAVAATVAATVQLQLQLQLQLKLQLQL